jgi:hypothetical protein
VFSGLGHDALIASNNEKSSVDAADTSQHVFDKILVTWHINDTDSLTTWQGQPGEAQVDGHLAFFFFPETIWINPCQGVNQSRLAVIYMTSSTNYAHRASFLMLCS